MKCPECGFESVDAARFCNECGVRLELSCPSCRARNPFASKFCCQCGHPMAPPESDTPWKVSFDEKIAKIQKYLPDGLTEKILSQKDRIEGEKKTVTVMFCDMEGYSRFAEKLGPESVYNLMDRVYDILTRKVNDYGGTVNELTGDGIMALFGAPVALEDAPQRAIRSALSIHRDMTRLSDQINSGQDSSAIRMRIGIHSGPVVMGTVGNDLRVDFKALGDTVNLASRMESLAEPGTTYVTGEVFKLTEGLFRFENLGEKKIKGRSTPVSVYRVLAPNSGRTRFDVSAERGLTPLIARERELEILMDAYRRSRAGRGQAVSIVSVAGMGKSRLLYEFRKAVSSENVTFLEGKCLSYSKRVAYHPLVEILKSNFRIHEEDTSSDISEKVNNGLSKIGIDVSVDALYLLELLSVTDNKADTVFVSPDSKKERIVDILIRVVLKGAQFRPLILAIEDLHWMDKSSEYVIREILDNIPAERVFFIFTYRPQFTPEWKTRSYHNQIVLSRLSDRECLMMAGHLLKVKSFEEDLGELLIEKTEGVPLFIEEFVRSFIDLGIIEIKDDRHCLRAGSSDVRIPSTIQDVIMSRVDALPESARAILKTGSAIEREFSYELLRNITGLPEADLGSILSELKNTELIYQRGIAPESTYVFRHAMIMEVVYDTILSRQKRMLHRSIGEAMEALYKGNVEEKSASLARHFIEGGMPEKAAQYLRFAARKARKSGLYIDAIEYSRKRISALEQLRQTEAIQKQVIDARTAMAIYYIGINRHAEAKKIVDPIVSLAVTLNYKKGLAGIFVALGSYHWAVENYEKAVDHLLRAIDAAMTTSDWLGLWYAYYFLGATYAYTSQFEKALEFFGKALALSETGNEPIGICFSKATMAGLVLNCSGRVAEAYKVSSEAVRTAEEFGDTHTKGMAYAYHGFVCFFKGDFEKACRFLTEAIALGRKTGHLTFKAWAESFLAYTYYYQQKYKKARKYFRDGMSTTRKTGQYSSWEIFQDLCLLRAAIADGDVLDRPFPPADYLGRNRLKPNEGMIEATIAEILIRSDKGRLEEAEKHIARAIEADKRNGTRWSLAIDHEILAGLCKKKGDQAGAIQNLSRAIEIMEECGADGWEATYRERLARDSYVSCAT